ncbi:MAG: WYL domain-containing protein, partial [Actinomycetota bacterium]|nr:WYL domain-containing protein [Actinomycetota bacterium]
LQDAARDSRLVLLGYVDPSGRATTRVVEPVSVEGGYLSAYDRKRETRLTYALHRVTTAALYDEQRA